MNLIKIQSQVKKALIFAFILALVLPAASPARAIGPQLYVSPSSSTGHIGSDISFQIWVDSDTELVNAVQANLSFDPGKMQFKSIDSANSAFSLIASNEVSGGSISIVRAVSVGSPGVQGVNLFATVIFSPITIGSTSLVIDADSSVLRSSDSSNIFATSTGANISLSYAPVSIDAPLYRLYKRSSDRHFYTLNPTERDTAMKQGYALEGVSSKVGHGPGGNLSPVYRLYLRKTDYHFYTNSLEEANRAAAGGFIFEGVGYYASLGNDSAVTPVYRLLNKRNGIHFFTINASERDQAVRSGSFHYEGIAFYAAHP